MGEYEDRVKEVQAENRALMIERANSQTEIDYQAASEALIRENILTDHTLSSCVGPIPHEPHWDNYGDCPGFIGPEEERFCDDPEVQEQLRRDFEQDVYAVADAEAWEAVGRVDRRGYWDEAE